MHRQLIRLWALLTFGTAVRVYDIWGNSKYGAARKNYDGMLTVRYGFYTLNLAEGGSIPGPLYGYRKWERA